MIVKSVYLLIGFTSLALGIIGAFLPVMPTTVFILIAAWAFARSSERLHHYLLEHPRTGPAIRAWRHNQSIPRKAKWLAAVSMLISWLIVWLTTNWQISLGVGLLLLAVLSFLLTRPSTEDNQTPAE